MSTNLLERIQQANKLSEKINKENVEAQARKELLLQQISEQVDTYTTRYGVEFPSLEDLDSFTDFLDNLLEERTKELEKEVDLAEKVQSLIEEGNLQEAKSLLGYEDPTPVKETKKEPKKAPLSSTPIEEEPLKDPLKDIALDFSFGEEDNEEGTPIEEELPVKEEPTPVSEVVPDLDISNISLTDLDELAEGEAPVRRRRRRRAVEVEEDEGSIADANPVSTGGAFKF